MIELARARRSSTATPTQYFQRWTDHDTWSQWDPDTQWVRLSGPVQVGTRGVMKPRGGPKVRFQIAECDPDRTYTDVSTLPGTRLTFRHSVTPAGTGSDLQIHVYLEGPLSRIWAATAFKGFDRSAIESLDRLIALVEA